MFRALTPHALLSGTRKAEAMGKPMECPLATRSHRANRGSQLFARSDVMLWKTMQLTLQ